MVLTQKFIITIDLLDCDEDIAKAKIQAFLFSIAERINELKPYQIEVFQTSPITSIRIP